jgi:RNA polymerase sigma-70 factor, ECF subfamily
MNAAAFVELIARARSGDGAALGELLDRYRSYLRLLAQRSLDGAAPGRIDASDVVQQSFLEAHRDFAHFAGGSEPEFLAWLRRILENNAAQSIERHVFAQKRAVDRERSLDETHGDAGPLRAALPASQTSPSRRAMLSEAAVRLAQALESLPPDQREAVRLRHIEGWSIEQMAGRLDRSEAAVAGLLKRGLRGLRRHFRGEDNQ